METSRFLSKNMWYSIQARALVSLINPSVAFYAQKADVRSLKRCLCVPHWGISSLKWVVWVCLSLPQGCSTTLSTYWHSRLWESPYWVTLLSHRNLCFAPQCLWYTSEHFQYFNEIINLSCHSVVHLQVFFQGQQVLSIVWHRNELNWPSVLLSKQFIIVEREMGDKKFGLSTWRVGFRAKRNSRRTHFRGGQGRPACGGDV